MMTTILCVPISKSIKMLLLLLSLASLITASSASQGQLLRASAGDDLASDYDNDNIDNNNDNKSSIDTTKRELQTTTQQEALEQARNQWSWTSLDMPLNYTYRFMESSGDAIEVPLYIDVRNGRVANVQAEFSFGDNIPVYNPADYLTFEQFFNLIQTTLEDSDKETADSTSVTYDEQYGYPTRISFDNGVTIYEIGDVVLYTVLQRDLDFRKTQWRQLQVTDYDYEIQQFCFCFGEALHPQLIQVRDSEIVDFIDTTTGVAPVSIGAFPTVNEIFDAIEEGIASFAHSVTVTYDNTYHYPLSYSINPNRLIADAGKSHEIHFLDIRRFTPEQAELDAAMTMWEGHGLTQYTMGYQNRCFCSEEYAAELLISVQDGVVTGVTKREPWAGDVVAEVARSVPSMDGIFGIIQEGINLNAPRVEVEYDSLYGYPTSVFIDYDEALADEETSLVIDHMAPISAWQSELDAARSKWEQADIDSYDYQFRRSCECLPAETEPKEVSVAGGTVTSVNGEDPAANSRIPTLLGLLDIIQDGINSNAFWISVEYDPVYGYPVSVTIDYDEYIADEEFIVTALLFEDSMVVDPPRSSGGPGLGPRIPFFCRGATALWFPRLCSPN